MASKVRWLNGERNFKLTKLKWERKKSPWKTVCREDFVLKEIENCVYVKKRNVTVL